MILLFFTRRYQLFATFNSKKCSIIWLLYTYFFSIHSIVSVSSPYDVVVSFKIRWRWSVVGLSGVELKALIKLSLDSVWPLTPRDPEFTWIWTLTFTGHNTQTRGVSRQGSWERNGIRGFKCSREKIFQMSFKRVVCRISHTWVYKMIISSCT